MYPSQDCVWQRTIHELAMGDNVAWLYWFGVLFGWGHLRAKLLDRIEHLTWEYGVGFVFGFLGAIFMNINYVIYNKL